MNPIPDVRYWPLNETSGGIAVDEVLGVEAVMADDPTNATHNANGKFGYCRDFGASSSGVSRLQLWQGAENAAGTLTTYTLTHWVRGTHQWPDPQMWFFGTWQANTGVPYFWSLITLGAVKDSVRLYLEDASGNLLADVTADTGGDLLDDAWHFIVFRCDGQKTDIIVDNQLAGTAQAAVTVNPSHPTAKYGGEVGDSYAYQKADDLRIYSWDLSDAEIAALWNNGDGLLPPEAPTPDAIVSLPTPLTAPRITAFQDWGDVVAALTLQPYYACEITDGATTIRKPISSWQGTAQRGRSSFVQAVIPAADTDLLATLSAMSDPDIVIYRGARLTTGGVRESELLRTRLDVVTYQEGPQRATIVVRGYAQRETAQTLTRTLRSVRSIAIDPNRRVRCEIDWFLQPGHTAVYGAISFEVAWINFYATTGDEYMDVGERPL